MLYAVYLQDVENTKAQRMALLTEHMEHIGRHLAKFRLGGPLMTQDASGFFGSLLLVEAESDSEIREMVEQDPYFKAGIWREMHIQPFNAVLDQWK